MEAICLLYPCYILCLLGYDHNLTEEVLVFKIGEGGRAIGDSRIISWLMKVRCRFSQITFRSSRRRCFVKM